MKYILIIILLICPLSVLYAQHTVPVSSNTAVSKIDSIAKARELQRKKLMALRKQKPKPILNELRVGLNIQTSGTFIHLDRYKMDDAEESGDKGGYLDFGELSHPRQYRVYVTTTPDPNNPNVKNVLNSFVYGKQNNLYLLRLGYAYKKNFTGWLYNKNVQMQWLVGGGLNIALLKPYYLAMKQTLGATEPFIKYSEENRTDFLDYFKINGSAGFTKGLNEMSYKGGLNLKQGILFNLFPMRKRVISCEIGMVTDIFTEKMPILVNAENKSTFISLYATVAYGKRWE